MTQKAELSVRGEEIILTRINKLLRDAGMPSAQLAPSGSEKAIRVKLTGAASWTIDVECPPVSYGLPTVCLVEPKKVLLAHVGYCDSICINDGQGLSLDPTKRDDIVAQATLDAFQLLERSYADSLSDYSEFFNELEGYWTPLPNSELGWADVRIDNTCRLLTGYNAKQKDASAHWFFTEQSAKNLPPEFQVRGLPDILGIYVPLQHGILPPARGEYLSVDFIHKVLAALDAQGQRVWKCLVENRTTKAPRLAFMLVSVPRKSGGYSFIGLTFYLKAGTVDSGKPPIPIRIERHTADFMRERGGADPALVNKRIAVLGCGSIGSEVADALASSGIGSLVLVDIDDLGVENVFRHFLGRNMLGQNKVNGVQQELIRKYPGLTAIAKQQTAQFWFGTNGHKEVDGIVIAIGMPTIEREMMRALRASGVKVPIVVTWIEALDLGGHAIGISTTGSGCLDCIYHDDEGAASLYPRVSFLSSGQVVTKNLTGCASTFVPYGAIQSRRIALLAAELMLDLLRGEPVPQYRYWIGKGKLAAAQGLCTTPWFANARNADEESISKHLFAEPCPTCRNAE